MSSNSNLEVKDESEASKFVDPPEDGADFVVDSPKGAIVETNETATGGTNYGDDRTPEPPTEQFEQNRLVYDTDPHVGHSIEVILDWILADGYNISDRNIAGYDASESLDEENIAALRFLIENSDFETKLNEWIEEAAVEGHGYMEIVVEEGKFKPRILPPEMVHKHTDEYGTIKEYVLEPEDGGGPEDEDATVYGKHDIAEFYFRKDPTEEYGRGLVERIREQADMLRDMEVDYARFVASKAYPPILWKCGDENNEWSEDQITNWLDDVKQIEPDSMVAGPHDVEPEVVGTTSTSASAGAMRLEETFKHHERRIVTGIGVPAVLSNMDSKGSSAEVIMPSFKRRIKRYQNLLLKKAVEEQIIRPLFVESILGQEIENYEGLIPEWEFGEHSSAENRLEIDKLLKLFNNGFLTREAFAQRAGIDPETELPTMEGLQEEVIPTLQGLANGERSLGDAAQNPDGGRPTDTEGGAQSSGREVTSREDATTDNSGNEDRPQKSPTEDES